jgi:hypothetical protein
MRHVSGRDRTVQVLHVAVRLSGQTTGTGSIGAASSDSNRGMIARGRVAARHVSGTVRPQVISLTASTLSQACESTKYEITGSHGFCFRSGPSPCASQCGHYCASEHRDVRRRSDGHQQDAVARLDPQTSDIRRRVHLGDCFVRPQVADDFHNMLTHVNSRLRGRAAWPSQLLTDGAISVALILLCDDAESHPTSRPIT